MDKQLFLLLLLFSLLMNLVSVFFIRQIIWSIVWCDKGGKHNRLCQLKQDQNMMTKLSMTYLKKNLHGHTKAFDFWINVKRIHSISLFLTLFASVVLLYMYNMITAFANWYCIALTIASCLLTVCLAFQFDTNRNTKYDRERIQRKTSKKRS